MRKEAVFGPRSLRQLVLVQAGPDEACVTGSVRHLDLIVPLLYTLDQFHDGLAAAGVAAHFSHDGSQECVEIVEGSYALHLVMESAWELCRRRVWASSG